MDYRSLREGQRLEVPLRDLYFPRRYLEPRAIESAKAIGLEKQSIGFVVVLSLPLVIGRPELAFLAYHEEQDSVRARCIANYDIADTNGRRDYFEYAIQETPFRISDLEIGTERQLFLQAEGEDPNLEGRITLILDGGTVKEL